MTYFHAKDIGVSVSGTVCGAQSFSVTTNRPITPIYQLGDLTMCGIMKAPLRGTATLTVLGDVPVLSGTWATIIATDGLTVACPLFGLGDAVCTGVTFTGRAGSPPSQTWTFSGQSFETGAGGDPGACGCGVQTADISGPTAAYTITASANVTYLEQFGSDEIVAVVVSQPNVTGTFEYYEGAGAAVAVNVGSMSIALDETVEAGQGGRGTVGGFATISVSYFAGKDGSLTAGLTIA